MNEDITIHVFKKIVPIKTEEEKRLFEKYKFMLNKAIVTKDDVKMYNKDLENFKNTPKEKNIIK